MLLVENSSCAYFQKCSKLKIFWHLERTTSSQVFLVLQILDYTLTGHNVSTLQSGRSCRAIVRSNPDHT